MNLHNRLSVFKTSKKLGDEYNEDCKVVSNCGQVDFRMIADLFVILEGAAIQIIETGQILSLRCFYYQKHLFFSAPSGFTQTSLPSSVTISI